MPASRLRAAFFPREPDFYFVRVDKSVGIKEKRDFDCAGNNDYNLYMVEIEARLIA